MPNVAANVRVGITGSIYSAPVGTPLPASQSTALNAAFSDLGYCNEDGISETFDDSVEDIIAWQSAQVVRATTSESSASLSWTMIETRANTLLTFHRGSTLTAPTAGNFRLDVKPIAADPRSWVLDVVDGTKLIRIVVGLGEVVERGEVMYRNGEAVGYPVTVRCYPDANGNLMQKMSNDAAWAPA
jgi:hypothetical protein